MAKRSLLSRCPSYYRESDNVGRWKSRVCMDFQRNVPSLSFWNYLTSFTCGDPGKKMRNWVTIADNFFNTGTGCYRNTNKGQCSRTVSWLKQLVVGLLSRRSGFYPRSIHVQFMVDRIVT